MIAKKEDKNEKFLKNIKKIKDIFNKYSAFFFYFSYDPDAAGASIALALYLKLNLNKECFVYVPKETEYSNVDYLFKISAYNDIKILSGGDETYDIIEKKSPVFVICDTPNHFLLSDFDNIISHRNKNSEMKIIEIDHHFGGDSEQIFPESITLFKHANSSCEIIAELLSDMEKNNEDSLWLDKAFPRNIIISLLVGIIFDTQNGKFAHDKETFKLWYNFLSERLKWITWENPSNIKDTEDILHSLNKLSKKELLLITAIMKDVVIINKAGLLIIDTSHESQHFNYRELKHSTIITILSDLVNRVPEFSGKVGIIGYLDNASDLYFIKVRRATDFKEFDLRKCEDLLKDIFRENFVGGGGHEGATSFRIAKIDKNDFLKEIESFHQKLSQLI